MVEKRLQQHDFITGGPKVQYTISFDDTYTLNGGSGVYFTIGGDANNFNYSTYSTTYVNRNGEVMYNTETGTLEYFMDGDWIPLNYGYGTT